MMLLVQMLQPLIEWLALIVASILS